MGMSKISSLTPVVYFVRLPLLCSCPAFFSFEVPAFCMKDSEKSVNAIVLERDLSEDLSNAYTGSENYQKTPVR